MRQETIRLVNRHVNKVLTVAEAALPRDQFLAFRKCVLDEFGERGLIRELCDMAEQGRSRRA